METDAQGRKIKVSCDTCAWGKFRMTYGEVLLGFDTVADFLEKHFCRKCGVQFKYFIHAKGR